MSFLNTARWTIPSIRFKLSNKGKSVDLPLLVVPVSKLEFRLFEVEWLPEPEADTPRRYAVETGYILYANAR